MNRIYGILAASLLLVSATPSSKAYAGLEGLQFVAAAQQGLNILGVLAGVITVPVVIGLDAFNTESFNEMVSTQLTNGYFSVFAGIGDAGASISLSRALFIRNLEVGLSGNFTGYQVGAGSLQYQNLVTLDAVVFPFHHLPRGFGIGVFGALDLIQSTNSWQFNPDFGVTLAYRAMFLPVFIEPGIAFHLLPPRGLMFLPVTLSLKAGFHF